MGKEATRQDETASGETAQPAKEASTGEGAHSHADDHQVPDADGQSEGQTAAPAQVEPTAQSSAANSNQSSRGLGSEGIATIPSDGGTCLRNAGADRKQVAESAAWPFVIEVYGPDGYLLHHESLYEFLRRVYVPFWNPDEFRFEELDIVLNGRSLLPKAQGRA